MGDSPDSHPLPLFNRQASLGRADDRVGKSLHLQQSNDLFHVSILLLLGNFKWLAQVGREAEGFADRLRGLVNIELLGVRRAALEFLSWLDAVD